MERIEQLKLEQKEWSNLFQEVLETIDELSKKYHETGSKEDEEILNSWLKEKEAYIELLKDYSLEISNERIKTRNNQKGSLDSLNEKYKKLEKDLSDETLSLEERIELMESVKKQTEEFSTKGIEYEKFGSNYIPIDFAEDYKRLIQEIEMQKNFNNNIISSIENNEEKASEGNKQEENFDVLNDETDNQEDNPVEEYVDVNQYATPSIKKPNVYSINYDDDYADYDDYDDYADYADDEPSFFSKLFGKFKRAKDDIEEDETNDSEIEISSEEEKDQYTESTANNATDNDELENSKPSFFSKLFGKFKRAKDDIEEDETNDSEIEISGEEEKDQYTESTVNNATDNDELENSKPSFFSKLFSKFKRTKDDTEEVEDYSKYDIIDIDNIEKPKDKKKIKKRVIVLAAGITAVLIAGISLIGSNCAGCSHSNDVPSSDSTHVPTVTVAEVLEHETVSIDGSGTERTEAAENSSSQKEIKDNQKASKPNSSKSGYKLGENLGENIKISEGSYIYTNAYDATNNTNGKTPYFSYSTSNNIVGVVLENNGSIASFVSLEDGTDTYEFIAGGKVMYLNKSEANNKINEMKNSGWNQTSVAVSNEKASSGVTGFYNVKSIRR